jgi:NitT/TauT family transport system permease protein
MKKIDYLKPNSGSLTSTSTWVIGILWTFLMVFLWITSASSFLPTPIDVIKIFPTLWNIEGLGMQLWISINLSLEASAIMCVLSLLIALMTVIPFFRPLATLISTGRFNGFVGLPLILLSLLHNPSEVKIALMVFGMSVFTIDSLVKMIEDIPKELFDHSRTLRMNEWRVVWEVVLLGKMDQIIDIFRINIGMGFVLLPFVEGMFKYQGGVGALMIVEEKHLNLDAVFCIMFIILGYGLLQDFIIGVFKKMLCPYAFLEIER